MAVVQHGSSLPDSSQKTDFYAIIDNSTVTGIIDADISSGAAIADTKLATISTAGKVNVSALTGQIAGTNLQQIITAAKVSGAALTLLGSIPSGAGVIPTVNLPNGGGALGAWTAKSFSTIYQATTDGLVVAYCFLLGASENINGYTDSNSTPTTLRQSAGGSSGVSVNDSICMPVRKGDYWEVTHDGSHTDAVYFIALGS